VKTDSIWDFNQRFQDLIGRLTFQTPNQQNQECFITELIPHILMMLIQQIVMPQLEALEIAMKSESSLVRDNG